MESVEAPLSPASLEERGPKSRDREGMESRSQEALHAASSMQLDSTMVAMGQQNQESLGGPRGQVGQVGIVACEKPMG